MPSVTRTFIAVDLPTALKTELDQFQQHLASDAPDVRWVDLKLCHITLAFLGDVPDTDLDLVCRHASQAAAGFQPFELALERLGAFPNPKRPRVVWVGLTGAGVETLKRLQQTVAQAVRQAGHPPADDRFSPHITLGRIKSSRGPVPDLTALLGRYHDWSAGIFNVTEVVTFASILAPFGPTYTPLARSPLHGGKPPATP